MMITTLPYAASAAKQEQNTKDMMTYKDQIDKSRMPRHVAIIMLSLIHI